MDNLLHVIARELKQQENEYLIKLAEDVGDGIVRKPIEVPESNNGTNVYDITDSKKELIQSLESVMLFYQHT